jgi:hypothetical protein
MADDTINLDIRPQLAAGAVPPPEGKVTITTYVPEKQRDNVRLIVTVGLLAMFAWVIVWASIESASWADHWNQTKDMLQIILPALTGLIGSVLGFYFGSKSDSKSDSNLGTSSQTSSQAPKV